jgi:hypothetical protein
MNDQISSAHMAQGKLTYFIKDRFGAPNSALALDKGYTKVKEGTYFNTPEFTISVWVCPQLVGSWARVIDFHDFYTGERVILSLDSDRNKKPTFIIYSTASRTLTSSQVLIEGRWQFLTATFNGTLMCIYIDGNLKGSQSFIFKMPAITRSYNYIGKSWNYFDEASSSFLDELRFYNKSLSTSEINQLMNSSSKNNITFWTKESITNIFKFSNKQPS